MVTKLKISHVSKSFGDKAVLIDVNLEVPQNKLVTILGTSGGGKTTLLRLIAGFESVDSGEIHIGDRLVSSSSTLTPPEKRNVGYIPQDASLFSHLTVAKNIEFGLQQLNTKAKAQRVHELLELIDLADLADSMPSQLSGGQQQRVAIARALALIPM